MEALTHWLGEHQTWILLATGLLAFFESLALVGILIPGVALLFATAVAAGSASVDLSLVLIAGFIGAVLGDGISFVLGRVFHHSILQLPLVNKHPEWIEKGEQFFAKHGIASIVIGRFIGPIRPVMPLVAGMLDMPAIRFYLINILSAVVWAPFYILPGYLIGSAAESQSLLQQQHLLLAGGIIGITWLVSQSLLALQQKPRTNYQQISAITASIAIALFLLTYLLTSAGAMDAINQAALQFFTSTRRPFLDTFFIGITLLGYWLPMAIWAAAVSVTLLLQRHFFLASVWVGATVATHVSVAGLKESIGFTRPSIVLHPPTSLSFPSGHTTAIIVFLGTLILLVRNNLSPAAYRLSIVIGSASVALVACSRLYLGVHWLTDIVAGICLGITIVAAVYWILNKQAQSPAALTSAPTNILFIATPASLLGGYLFTIAPTFLDAIERYQLIEIALTHG